MSDSLSMPSLLSNHYPTAQPRPRQDFSMQQAAMEARQAEISITTAEGDRVTLSSAMASMQAFQYDATGAGQNISFVTTSLNTANYAMSVEGDLNAQELADITSLVKDLALIAKDFFKGNLDQAMSKAMDIGDTGTIKGFSAEFTYTGMTNSLLSDYHPIPALSENNTGSEVTTEAAADVATPQPDLIDLLRGQWEQLKELLEQQQTAKASEAPEIPAPQEVTASPAAVAQDMMDRAATTMTEHPRLSPLLQPLADRVIDNLAASMPQPASAHGRANRLHHEFARAWHRWLTAA